MSRTGLMIAVLLFSGGLRANGYVPVPSPDLPPERVVAIQLEALQHNDEPYADAGIEITWAFAHPANKIMTGPLERFAVMIKGPVYGMLVGHREHEIKRVAVTGDTAVVAVTVVPASGPMLFYQWKLEKVLMGEHQGAWMTVAVSPPAQRGDSI